MAHHTDVLVIGAGVIGTAVAYNLAKEGIEVLVVERDGIGEGTSGACDGFVILQSKSPGIHLELAMESAKLYTNLAEELEYHIHYKRPGGLILIETPEQLAVMREVVAKQKRSGLEVELIGGDEARKFAPYVPGQQEKKSGED
ncbi:MAG: NAD(P)/FAD-dependent oxidoreductase [bacterium]